MSDFSALEQQYGLPTGLLAAVSGQESNDNPNAIGPVTRTGERAIGQFQIMPATAKELGVDPTDPAQAADGAARYLAQQLKAFGTPELALAAYNAGPGNVKKYGGIPPFKETQNYVQSIMSKLGNSSNDTLAGGAANDQIDYSKLSDDELLALAQQHGGVQDDSAKSTPDYSSLSDDELLALAQQHVAVKDQPGFLSRVGTDFNKRVDDDVAALNAFKSGQLAVPGLDPTGAGQLGLQLLGKGGAGFVNDVAGEALTSGFHALPEAAQGFIKDKAGDVADYVKDSAVGRLGGKAIDAYEGFAKDNPNASRSLDAAANLATALPITKVASVPAAKAGEGLEKAGDAVVNSAATRAAKAKTAFLHDLVSPKATPTVRADQFGRSVEKGLLKSSEIVPSAQEQAMIDAVATLPVKKSNSLLKNYGVINKANRQEAQALTAQLEGSKAVIPDNDIIKALADSKNELANHLYVAGGGEKSAEAVVNGALDKIMAHPRTPAGLLQARKDFDAWVKSQRGAGIFDPARENAVSTAVLNVRQKMNDLIAQAVPDAAVKDSLAKQSSLYRTMENLRGKGAFEAKNMPQRLMQRLDEAIPVKNPYLKTGLELAGLGALYAHPALTGAAIGAYGVGKAATSPTAQKALGKVISTTGGALQLLK